MKRIFILFFLALNVCVLNGQTKSARLTRLIGEYEVLNDKNIKQVNATLDLFLEEENLNCLELQYVFYLKGIYYNNIRRLEESVFYFKKSINYKESKELYSKCIYHLSDLCFTLQQYEESYKYAFQIVGKIDPNKNPSDYINIQSILGGYYTEIKKYDIAILEYQKAIDIANKSDSCLAVDMYIKQAKRYSEKGSLIISEKLITKGLTLMEKCNFNLESKSNIYKSLIEISIKNKNTNNLKKLFDELYKIEGALKKEKRNQKLDSLETVYKTKIKEEQNKVLKKSNLEKEQNIKVQKIALFATFFGILLLTGLLFYIFRISKQQQQTNKKLERLNLLNQKIFSVISHDFKGPITTLKLLLNNKNTIQDENPAISMYMNDIKNQLDQSDFMLDNLLEWAKNELLINKIAKQKIAIHDFIAANCTENKLKILEKNITIDNNIPQNTTIEFNESVLKIVFRNILNNAVKFSYEGSKIEINWTNNSLEIVDYGKGIDDEKLKSLFKKNINPGLGTNMETGFGIGLYLSYELMVKNGGNITVKKNKTGSSFSICFK